MKTTSTRIIAVSFIILLFALALLYFIFYKKSNSDANEIKSTRIDSLSPLLSIENLENFYQQDKSNDIEFLSEKKSYGKKVKSIKIHRFSTTYQKMLLEKELFFDFKGKLLKVAFYSDEDPDTAFTYMFYNDRGKIFLNVSVERNKYDTVYTLRNFDAQNHIKEEIQYNIKRKELNHYETRNFKLMSDSILKIEETSYEHDLTTNNILPYYIWDMNLTLKNLSEVNANIHRTVCQDTVYNSDAEELYRLEDHKLVSEKDKIQFEYNPQGDWLQIKTNAFLIKRDFIFYADNEAEVKKDFSYSKTVLAQLDSIMQTLAPDAWKNHREKHNGIDSRTKLYKEGRYGKAIEIKKATTINAFTPELWYLVNLDSGYIPGIEGKCVVVGYNTPLKDSIGFNKRCLAIYERINDTYELRKESFTALESFSDYNEDFLFQDYNEANFSVGIQDGEIVVTYGYMRGEVTYSYAYQDGNWVLTKYESSHRTCCQAESYSYNYKTKIYSASISSTSEDDEGYSKDTSITVKQNRPIMYMDSMNVMQFDYDETGLLVK